MLEPAPVPASHSTAALKKCPAKRKQRVRKARINVPPPLAFDLLKVPGTALLTVVEVARAVRRSPQTVRLWHSQPDHIIKSQRGDDVFSSAPSA